ncbi:MAG: energy transducer TonB [Acidobacteria bacterium]|nr:energy transducer TonB [Acidobacteriota bacterium]
MTKRSIPLQTISIAAPCTADWGKMVGNDKVRFCQECKLNVYNLSAMTEYQAEDLIRKTEGRLCVRYFRRADGTILTENCPVGLQALRKKIARTATAVISALLSFITGFGLFAYMTNKRILSSPVMGSMAYVPPNTTDRPLPNTKTYTNTEIKGEMVINSPEIPTETPKDELVNTETSSCSTKNPDVEMGVIMGKIASPINEGNFEMGDVAVPNGVERSEKELLKAAIESPEAIIFSEKIKGSFTVKVRIEIDNSGNVISVENISSNSVLPEVVDSALSTAYQWKFDINRLNSSGAPVRGTLTFHIKN